MIKEAIASAIAALGIRQWRPCIVLCAGLSFTLPAASWEIGGYLRLALGSKDGAAVAPCYGLGGPGMNFKLGNECDQYGEVVVRENFGPLRGHFMPSWWQPPEQDSATDTFAIQQAYLEAPGLGPAGSTPWLGRRFYGRTQVLPTDTKFTVRDGTGLGLQDLRWGPGRFSLAWFTDYSRQAPDADRLDLDYAGLATNPGGSVRLMLVSTRGRAAAGRSGLAASLIHEQALVAGLANTVWLQWARGSADLDGGFGDLGAPDSAQRVRLVEKLLWREQRGGVNGPWSAEAVLMFEQGKDAAAQRSESASLGGRLAWAWAPRFKLLIEAGVSQRRPQDGATERLHKLTLAPTWSPGGDLYARPELRLFATWAGWNDAANAGAGASGIGPYGDGRKRGSRIGLQFEHWF